MEKWCVCVVLLSFTNFCVGIQSFEEILRKVDFKANSAKCFLDLNYTLTALTEMELWALQMFDASSKIPSGILKGNVDMGYYDECLSVNHQESRTIKGQFCKGSVNTNEIVFSPPPQINTEVVGYPRALVSAPGLSMYLCVPDSCTSEDLNPIFQNYLTFSDECFSKDTLPELDGLAIFAIILFAIIAAVLILSTVYDIYRIRNEEDPIHPIAIAFSLYTNSKKIFRLGGSQQMGCLNGLKALSMIWVVMGHAYFAYLVAPLQNIVDVFEWLQTAKGQYITGATVSVDTFFVIGGFLTVYSFEMAMAKGTKFNIPLYYFHRILRLTPALAALVLAHAALFNYFGDGPAWEGTNSTLVEGCRTNWWTTLLYVQNYVDVTHMCVPQSWYLAVDMQLFLISPIFLVLLHKKPTWGFISLTGMILISILASFLSAWFFELGAQLISPFGSLQDFMKFYYFPTHTRMGSYFIGMLLGYAIYVLKSTGQKIKIHKLVSLIIWVITLGVLATCIYAGHNLQINEYDHVGNSLFVGLMRPGWSIGICWVIFACLTGYGGPVNDFLSLPVFQILSRFCYSIYLVHYGVILMTRFNIKHPLIFSDYIAIHGFMGDFAFSAAIAVLWSLTFESPIIILEKILLGNNKSEPKQSEKKTPL